MSGFFFSQATEKAQLDDLGLPRVGLCQLIERFWMGYPDSFAAAYCHGFEAFTAHHGSQTSATGCPIDIVHYRCNG